MPNDKKLLRWLGILIVAPLTLAIFAGDRFRYPCQDPANWDSPQCQKPICEIMRQCPEHIFQGNEEMEEIIERSETAESAPVDRKITPTKGAECK